MTYRDSFLSSHFTSSWLSKFHRLQHGVLSTLLFTTEPSQHLHLSKLPAVPTPTQAQRVFFTQKPDWFIKNILQIHFVTYLFKFVQEPLFYLGKTLVTMVHRALPYSAPPWAASVLFTLLLSPDLIFKQFIFMYLLIYLLVSVDMSALTCVCGGQRIMDVQESASRFISVSRLSCQAPAHTCWAILPALPQLLQLLLAILSRFVSSLQWRGRTQDCVHSSQTSALPLSAPAGPFSLNTEYSLTCLAFSLIHPSPPQHSIHKNTFLDHFN